MMIVATWFLYCMFIAAVLTGAAYAWEKGARWSGGPARWGWLAALAGSVTLPWLLRLLPARTAEALPVAIPVIALDPVVLDAGAAAAGWSASDAALFGWAASSVLVFAWVAFALFRLGRQRRAWRETELDGGRVLVTRGVGPAAVGVRAAQVVIPTWALQLDAELRGLLLRHEREHVRAGDPRLLLAALVLLAAMPWNPLVWLQVLRLRNAIELDCDARVLASGADPERYGSLLLEVGQRRSSSAFVMATFAEPRVFLEQRIRRIARWPVTRRPIRAAGFALVGLVLFATALSARDPLRTGMLPATSASAEIPLDLTVLDVLMPSDTPPAQPTFTPMTDRPELSNREEVVAALLANYPPLLRDAGIGGAPTVWMYIDERGRVTKTQMSRSSGYPALDEAAIHVAAVMEFSPALNRGAPVAVWVEIPVVFKADDAELRATPQPQSRERLQPRARAVEEQPLRQPRPELLNADEIARALVRNYPPLLRDAGIGSTADVRVLLDAAGAVTDARIATESGYPALDQAALAVARQMRFSPPERAPMQLDVPVSFTARDEVPVRTPLPQPQRVPAPSAEREVEALKVPLPALPERSQDISARPTFTPMTERPELLNRNDVARALVQAYPPPMRDAGIGGSPVVWFFIDDTGRVAKVQLSKSSGYPALDEAALRVATQMQFSPARNRDREVAVWVEIPIVFTAK